MKLIVIICHSVIFLNVFLKMILSSVWFCTSPTRRWNPLINLFLMLLYLVFLFLWNCFGTLTTEYEVLFWMLLCIMFCLAYCLLTTFLNSTDNQRMYHQVHDHPQCVNLKQIFLKIWPCRVDILWYRMFHKQYPPKIYLRPPHRGG